MAKELIPISELEKAAPIFRGKVGNAFARWLLKVFDITAVQHLYDGAVRDNAPDTAAALVSGLDLKYTVAQENCNDRAALAQGLQQQTMQEMSNTNAIMAALRDGFQALKDEFCADRLDAERHDNANLRSELMYARGQASQVAQTSQIVDNIYNRLSQCPVNTVSVYGNQPVFRCAGPVAGNNCGCGNNGFGFAA